jgi:hypothetical protein
MHQQEDRRSAKESIVTALGEVRFERNELAYLALTSKPELHLRDRLAWRLHCALPGVRVAREWRRTDLAIFPADGVPVAVVELKATGTGDVSWGRAGPVGGRASFAVAHGAESYLEALLRADAAKMAAAAPGADGFVLVVVTHVADPVPPSFDAFIKYGRQLRVVADERAAERVLDRYLVRLGPVTKVQLGKGEAFGLRASVAAWLCGPVKELTNGGGVVVLPPPVGEEE